MGCMYRGRARNWPGSLQAPGCHRPGPQPVGRASRRPTDFSPCFGRVFFWRRAGRRSKSLARTLQDISASMKDASRRAPSGRVATIHSRISIVTIDVSAWIWPHPTRVALRSQHEPPSPDQQHEERDPRPNKDPHRAAIRRTSKTRNDRTAWVARPAHGFPTRDGCGLRGRQRARGTAPAVGVLGAEAGLHRDPPGRGEHRRGDLRAASGHGCV